MIELVSQTSGLKESRNPNFVFVVPLETNYFELLDSIDGDAVLYEQMGKQSNKEVFIRHDIDVSLDLALLFAREEYRSNIHSTYYLLSSSVYWKQSEEFLFKVKSIQDWGHDIGLHNNYLSVYLVENIPLKDLIKRDLDFLRENGIRIEGVAAHGSPHSSNMGYYNYEIWKEFDLLKNVGGTDFSFEKVSLKDFDLKYEASFMLYDAYLSDSRGDWIGLVTKPGEAKPFEPRDATDGLGIISYFNAMEKGLLQLSLHPERWIKKV